MGRAAREGLFWVHSTQYNHSVIGYARVLEKGFDGLSEEIRSKVAATTPVTAQDWQARMVMESTLVVAKAAAEIGKRYADKVRALRASCDDPVAGSGVGELEAVARQCRRDR